LKNNYGLGGEAGSLVPSGLVYLIFQTNPLFALVPRVKAASARVFGAGAQKK
jgi:hypothetical protein